MARFDRYLLAQLLVLFGFFSLVLVSVYWINRAVQLFDKLIGEGSQTAWIFAEFTALTCRRDPGWCCRWRPSRLRSMSPTGG
ncbi:MAG: hypothetical protein R3D85_12530 [Paracoccaceae bacterium]